MKILAYVIGAIVLLIVVVVAVGFALPKAHVASVRARYKATPEQVYRAIVDVQNGPKWRTGLKKAEIIKQQPLEWHEEASWGNLTMVMDEAASPSRVVSRIADTSQGFGGTWTYDVKPEGTGSLLTITENGEVYNPVFRVMSKFVFGYYKSLETYATDLGKLFKEPVQPERVQ